MRIYCTDAGGKHPVHGAYWNAIENCWSPLTWDEFGFFVGPAWPRSVDLVQE